MKLKINYIIICLPELDSIYNIKTASDIQFDIFVLTMKTIFDLFKMSTAYFVFVSNNKKYRQYLN